MKREKTQEFSENFKKNKSIIIILFSFSFSMTFIWFSVEDLDSCGSREVTRITLH